MILLVLNNFDTDLIEFNETYSKNFRKRFIIFRHGFRMPNIICYIYNSASIVQIFIM